MMRMKMRYYWARLLLLFGGLTVLFFGCLGTGFVREAGFEPGEFEGTGQGYRGPIEIRLLVSPAGIEDIAILSHSDSAIPGLAAMEELLEMVLETGSTDLDAISGATFSSRGFLEAVDDALEKTNTQ